MNKKFKDYIDWIIEAELQRLKDYDNPFLQNGDMGVVVFLFWMYDKSGEFKYKSKAEILLNSLSDKIFKSSLLEIYNGLSGIGIGVSLLFRKGHIKEHPDDILKSVDDYIYSYTIKSLIDYNKRYENTYLDILLYLSIRIKDTQNNETKMLLERLWFKLFNDISMNISPEFFYEPIPAELKYKLAQFIFICALGSTFNYHSGKRVKLILNEFKDYIFSIIPRYHFNRLLLYSAIKELDKTIHLDKEWNSYLETLFNSISLEYIIENELLPNDIYLTHGIPCLYTLLNTIGYKFDRIISQKMLNKVVNSNLIKYTYQEMQHYNYVGLDGILGLIYILVELKYINANDQN